MSYVEVGVNTVLFVDLTAKDKMESLLTREKRVAEGFTPKGRAYSP